MIVNTMGRKVINDRKGGGFIMPRKTTPSYVLILKLDTNDRDNSILKK